MSMTRFAVVVLCAAVLLGGLAGEATAATINFDDVTATSNFVLTVALTEAYAAQGVHFTGPGLLDGGGILNQNSNFGLNAYSGVNFLAFHRNAVYSDGGLATDPETITFDTLMTTVSIYAAGANSTDSFTMTAYDASHNLVDSDSLSTQGWAQLSVSASGIKYVILQQSGDNAFVYDDLSYNAAAPLPGALPLLGSGLLGLVAWRRLRKG